MPEEEKKRDTRLGEGGGFLYKNDGVVRRKNTLKDTRI